MPGLLYYTLAHPSAACAVQGGQEKMRASGAREESEHGAHRDDASGRQGHAAEEVRSSSQRRQARVAHH